MPQSSRPPSSSVAPPSPVTGFSTPPATGRPSRTSPMEMAHSGRPLTKSRVPSSGSTTQIHSRSRRLRSSAVSSDSQPASGISCESADFRYSSSCRSSAVTGEPSSFVSTSRRSSFTARTNSAERSSILLKSPLFTRVLMIQMVIAVKPPSTGDLGARHEARRVGEEPQDGAHQLARVAVPLHRRVAQDRGLALGCDEVLHAPLGREEAGRSAFTRTPFVAHSRARFCVRFFTPAFATE